MTDRNAQKGIYLNELSSLMILLIVSFFITGCGGGGGGRATLPAPSPQTPVIETTRSLQLNNYGSFHLLPDADKNNTSKLEAALKVLAKSDNVCIGEGWQYINRSPGWTGLTPTSIKALNPKAKVYEYWSAISKPEWDTDWGLATPPSDWRMQCPLTWKQINDNNWWLRDGNGNKVHEPGHDNTWLLDVGKSGFKEAYLAGILNRMRNDRYDGPMIDFLWPGVEKFMFDRQGIPMPTAYPTDDEWYVKAWQPFLKYVCDGVHEAGYKIIGVNVGLPNSGDPRQDFQRTLFDGTNYERWMFDFDGSYFSGAEAEEMINAAYNDPLECIITDCGLVASDPQYDSKHLVSVAAYYIALPGTQQNRTYGNKYNQLPHWQPVWDFNIGSPADPMTKMAGKYFWSRKFTNGIVLLNYDASEDITYTLDRAYKDIDGKVYTGRIVVPSHSAKILAIQAP